MRAVEPLLVIVVSASDLNSTIAGAVTVCLEFKLKREVGVFLVCEEPDIVVVGVGHRISEYSLAFDLEKMFVAVLRGTFYFPAGKVFSVEKRLPLCVGFGECCIGGTTGGACAEQECKQDARENGFNFLGIYHLDCDNHTFAQRWLMFRFAAFANSVFAF